MQLYPRIPLVSFWIVSQSCGWEDRPMYHPWTTNILMKNSPSTVDVPIHLYGVYGVDLSSHAWYCYTPVSLVHQSRRIAHQHSNCVLAIPVRTSRSALLQLQMGFVQAPRSPWLRRFAGIERKMWWFDGDWCRWGKVRLSRLFGCCFSLLSRRKQLVFLLQLLFIFEVKPDWWKRPNPWLIVYRSVFASEVDTLPNRMDYGL